MIPNLTEEQYSAIGKIIIAYNNIELMLRYAYGWLIFDVDDGLAVTEIMRPSTENLCAGIRYLLLKRCNQLAVDDFDIVVQKIESVKQQRNTLAHSFVLNSKNGDDVFLKIQKNGSPKKKESLKDFLKTTSYDISELQKIVEETGETVQETIRFVKKLQEFMQTNFKFQMTTDTNFKAE